MDGPYKVTLLQDPDDRGTDRWVIEIQGHEPFIGDSESRAQDVCRLMNAAYAAGRDEGFVRGVQEGQATL